MPTPPFFHPPTTNSSSPTSLIHHRARKCRAKQPLLPQLPFKTKKEEKIQHCSFRRKFINWNNNNINKNKIPFHSVRDSLVKSFADFSYKHKLLDGRRFLVWTGLRFGDRFMEVLRPNLPEQRNRRENNHNFALICSVEATVTLSVRRLQL